MMTPELYAYLHGPRPVTPAETDTAYRDGWVSAWTGIAVPQRIPLHAAFFAGQRAGRAVRASAMAAGG